jgi:hypothetical protein
MAEKASVTFFDRAFFVFYILKATSYQSDSRRRISPWRIRQMEPAGRHT